MKIEKAIKAAELLRQKEELENFFEKIDREIAIKKVVVHFDLIATDGTVYPCFTGLDAQNVLPCLRQQLDAVTRAIKNL